MINRLTFSTFSESRWLKGSSSSSHSNGTIVGQVAGLPANFRLHDLFPELFLERLGGGQLFVNPPDDLRVIGQRQENAGGQVIEIHYDDEGQVAAVAPS